MQLELTQQIIDESYALIDDRQPLASSCVLGLALSKETGERIEVSFTLAHSKTGLAPLHVRFILDNEASKIRQAFDNSLLSKTFPRIKPCTVAVIPTAEWGDE